MNEETSWDWRRVESLIFNCFEYRFEMTGKRIGVLDFLNEATRSVLWRFLESEVILNESGENWKSFCI